MPGKLIYLMGPSGSGKDSLIDAVRPYLPERGCEVIRRVITRSSEAVGEDALGVSHERFQSLKEEGAFAMHWQANGLEYGIPVEIDQWLNSGRHVLVNGSRGYLKHARERYPDLLAIMLYVDTGVLHQRLQARGRETPAEISDRLQRNQLFIDSIDEQQSEQVSVLNNSAALSLGVQGFLALIDASLAPAAHSA